MFEKPFSFEGRIRRTEYGLSLIMYGVAAGVVEFIGLKGGVGVVAFAALIPLIWFIWAQGAKRCHDRGNSGFFQLIPFYGFWMLFADSENGVNEYGANPKGIGNGAEVVKEAESAVE